MSIRAWTASGARGRPAWRGGRPVAAGLLVVALAGCAPVGVTWVGPEAVHRTLTASVISTGEPSATSVQVLRRFGLFERFQSDPAATLAELHRGLGPAGQEYRVFALAELSFLHAQRTGSRPHYLAAAVYAYAVLFPEGAGTAPGRLDPLTRLAADLYNRALTEGLRGEGGERGEEEVRLAAGRYPLSFGDLEMSLAPGELTWAGRRLEHFAPAAKLQVHGLRNRYREAGLGAPLAASLGPPVEGTPVAAHSRVPPDLRVPVTALLRLDGARRGLVTGHVHGRLELFSKDADAVTTVDGREVPLEYEPTAALAYTLDRVPVWRREIRRFLSGDFASGGGGQLFTMTPYRPGRVPVVLVHGTVSSPSRWAELINELDSDPRIGPHVQFWLFTYNTGNPLPYSAGLLHETLADTVAELDPEGRDPALRRMVVIGHSQGGLLTKLTVVDSGSRFWDNVSGTPLSEFRVSPETRAILARSMFFRPLPFVSRVVFIATPHRGSEVAGVLAERLRGLIGWALTLPVQVVATMSEAASGTDDPLIRRTLAMGLPRSVDNMSPSSRFIRTLAPLPVAPGVLVHSIIAVQGEDPPEGGGDGVVSYRSAHLDEAVSEKVVRSGHSVQSNPEAIEEVRRILLEHLGAAPVPR